MKKFVSLAVVALALVGCSSSKDPYQARADAERERQERYAERAIDKAPKWMTELPKSNSAVYANGTSVSGDFSLADEKAKVIAFGKICMAAGGEVDKQSRVYMADVGGNTVEHSEMAIRSMCRKVDVSGAEIVDIKRITEGSRVRSYVLVALPTGEANAIQVRKDRLAAQQRAEARSQAAFKEMDKPQTD